jgi:hypothetical protein
MINRYSMGWIPDYPDFRDYTEETEEVKEILEPSGLLLLMVEKKSGKTKSFLASLDLREWCCLSKTRAGSAPALLRRESVSSNITRENPLAGTSTLRGFFSKKSHET